MIHGLGEFHIDHMAEILAALASKRWRRALIQNPMSPLYSRIYELVRQVPPGRVTTYGRIAQEVGCTARTVGFAMAALSDGHDLPWHRVINSQGKVSPRRNNDGDLVQRLLLEAEGVEFDSFGRVDLILYARVNKVESP